MRVVDQNEWPGAVSDCMATAGFAMSISPDGGLSITSLPAEQEQAYTVAYFTCTAEYPLNPVYRVPLSEEQLRYLYWYWDGTLRSCLTDNGYSISEAPSEARFLETYDSEEGWAPFAEVHPATADEWFDVVTSCTEYPQELYGM